MKWLLPLLLLPVTVLAEQFAVTDFSGGLNSQYSSLAIADNEAQDALNVYFDRDKTVEMREGFTTCGSSKSYTYSGAWSYSDSGNSAYIIVRGSDSIIASNQGCNFTVRVATVNANLAVNAVTALGYIWFVDRERGVYYWNGTSTTFVTGSPLGQYITEYRERICVAGLAHPNGNALYCSAYLDGTNWTTSSTLATGAALFRVSLNDAYDNITSLFSGYNDSMQVFKNNSMYGLYGFDKDDFQIRVLSKEAGCVDQRSIQPYMGGLVFASNRGIEFFNGVQVQTPPISDKVKDKVGAAVSSSFNEASWVQTTQVDFGTGAALPNPPGVGVSTAIVSGAVIVSSFGAVDTSASDFSLGTSSNITITSSIKISTNNVGSISDNSFETSSLSTNWNSNLMNRVTSISANGCTVSPDDSSTFVNVLTGVCVTDQSVYFSILDENGVGISTATLSFTSSCSGWANGSISDSSLAGKRVKFQIRPQISLGGYLTTKASYIFSGNITLRYRTDSKSDTCSGGATPWYISFDNIQNGSSTITSGLFISQTFDAGLQKSSATMNASWTVDDSTPTLELQTSVATGGPWTTVMTGTGTIGGTANRYLRYVSSFTTSPGDANSTVDDVTLVVHSSGTFYSAVKNSPNLTSWSTLAVTKTDDGGSHTFFMRSSDTAFTVLSSTPAWQSQAANTVISISTGTYFQFRDDFKVSAATQAPTLFDFTISWNEGSLRNPMASITDDKRYYLSLATTTTASENTATLVLSPGPVWSIWDLKAGAFVDHRGTIYHTNNSNNGKVYTPFLGTSDDGAAINAFVKTKDYTLGDITKDKLFDSFYMISDSISGSGIDTSYFINRSTTSYALHSLSLTSGDGILSEKLNFPIDQTTHPNRGKTISLRLGNDDLDESMKFYGGILNYKMRKTE